MREDDGHAADDDDEAAESAEGTCSEGASEAAGGGNGAHVAHGAVAEEAGVDVAELLLLMRHAGATGTWWAGAERGRPMTGDSTAARPPTDLAPDAGAGQRQQRQQQQQQQKQQVRWMRRQRRNERKMEPGGELVKGQSRGWVGTRTTEAREMQRLECHRQQRRCQHRCRRHC